MRWQLSRCINFFQKKGFCCSKNLLQILKCCYRKVESKNPFVHFIKKHPIVSFFILAYIINWGGLALNMAGIFPSLGEWPLMFEGHEVALFRGRRILLNWAPNFAAIIVLSITCGASGIRNLFSKFLVWRVEFKWWLIAFSLPVTIALVALVLHAVTGGKTDFSKAVYLPGVFLLRNLFSLSTGSIGEEAGWRGFALPRLQKLFGPFRASILLGIIWALWHIPALTIRRASIEYGVYFMTTVVCLSILYTWVFNGTKGSLLIIAILHNIGNAVDATLTHSFAAVLPRENFMRMFAIVMISIAIVLIIKTRGKLGIDKNL